jgi:hypothetical protein
MSWLRNLLARAPRPRPTARPRPAPEARLRFDRTVGFWLGAAVLGTAGCCVGLAMPYRHPAAVTASVLWWGVLLGCLGGSVCAVLGLWAEPTRPSPAPGRRPSSNSRPVVRRGPSRFSGERRRRF